MKLVSKDIADNQGIPSKFTCDGENISPHLAWSDIPDGAKSFALSCNDPDAPAGDWIHWLIVNIPININEIGQGQTAGIEIENDFDKNEYGGPCPHFGKHRYVFKIYALNKELPMEITKENFFSTVNEAKIGEAVLVGTYHRQ